VTAARAATFPRPVRPNTLRTNNGYCTGDNNVGGTHRDHYVVRAPDNTPLDSTDNQPICAVNFSPYDTSVSPLPRARRTVVSRACRSQPISTTGSGCARSRRTCAERRLLHPGAHQCDLTNKASTPADDRVGQPEHRHDGSAATQARRHNRFGLRAGWAATDAGGYAPPRLAGRRAPADLRERRPGQHGLLYLARITPDYAGKTLQLSLWDLVTSAGRGNR